MMKKLSGLFFLPSLAFLAACGDDVTQINQTGLEVVGSAADLPECTEKNEGEQAVVKGETSIRVCIDGDWTTMNSENSGADFACKTEELKDGSGLKIVCNGDSIGVVLNGSDGKDAVLPGDTLEADSERVATKLDSVVGLTQKGPFLKGSTVYLYELSDGRTLKQTNGNFTSNITRDDGRYKFSARDLVSQYAMVVVDGNYRNEVTGVPSNAPIRLKAITDMRKRNTVNVNLLTHMEFDRVYHLVTRGDSTGKKLTVKQAKRQAQKEILKQFHIELHDNTDAEDMDVFGKTEADAALLAVSVLLQGDSNETALTVLLTEISNAIEEKGKWNDSATKARLVDWALKADTENRLAQFRKNVANWHLGDNVPDFEKLVRNYVGVEAGLGVCGSEKTSVGTFAYIPNVNSTYYARSYESIDASKNSLARVICDGEGGDHWRIATALERDTEGWPKDTAEGSVNKGKIDTSLTYVFEDGKWRHGTGLDFVIGFGCTQKMAAKDSVLKKSDEIWYKCADTTITVEGVTVASAWHLMSDFEKDYVDWKKYRYSDVGKLMNGHFTGMTMVWDADTLREASDYEILLKKACVTSMYGTMDSLSNTLTYSCDESGWSKTGTFSDNKRGRPFTTYKAVQIGNQVWMAENLNYGKTGRTQDLSSSSLCYGDIDDNCSKYGRLYLWSAAMDSAGATTGGTASYCGNGRICSLTKPVRGVCPVGWHLPTRAEWETLVLAVDESILEYDTINVAARYLKALTGWDRNGNGTDNYSFSALPAGFASNNGSFGGAGLSTTFWSASELSRDSVIVMNMPASFDGAMLKSGGKASFFSVRCLKD